MTTVDRLQTVAAVVLVLLWGGTARAQTDRDKIDPLLRLLLDPSVVVQIDQAPQPAAPGGVVTLPVVEQLVLRRQPGPAPTTVDVLVSLTSRSRAALTAVGADVRATMGSLFAARLPVATLATLAADPSVRYIQAAGRARLTNDLAMADIGADQVRTLVDSTFTGVTGAGVIAGFVDTGIDWQHGDFKHPNGRSRILYIWDQTWWYGDPPGEVGGQWFYWGSECDGEDIDDGLCDEQDTHGHGTHVAGTAAGNGSATGNGEPAFQYTGVAPNADIIMVKTTLYIVDIIEGVEYVFKRAEVAGKPAVVNLSLGSTGTAHDGTDLWSQALDSLSGPGRIVVVGAGNEGYNRNTALYERPLILSHATQTLTSVGDGAQLTFTIPPYMPDSGAYNDRASFTMWYDSRDRITITVQRPDGTALTAGSGDSAATSDGPGGRIYLDASTIQSPLNGDAQALLSIYDAFEAQPPAAGNWGITVQVTQLGGTGRFDIWESSTLSGSTFSGIGDNGYNVTAPGNAQRVITVGAYTTRTSWATLAYSSVHFTSQSVLGDLATFSSSGPTRPTATRPSRQKPDLVAPGTAIISTLSASASPRDTRTATDGVHTVNQGTSMAAPMVTGTTALLLEGNALLTPEDIQLILTGTARQDSFTAVSWAGFGGGTPNPSWGYGKLDVHAALGGDRLTVTAGPHLPAQRATIGTIPVLQFTVGTSTVEDVLIDSLSVTAESGGLVSALVPRLLLYADSAGAGTLPESGALAIIDNPFANGSTAVFPALGMRFAAGSQATFLVAAAIDDRLRQGDSVSFALSTIRGTGTLTHRPAGVVMPSPVGSALGPAMLLDAGEVFLISENPVRGGRVIFSYASPPTSMALYSFAGVRVRNFTQLPPDRFEWDLRNESPGLPNGMYVLVVKVDGQVLKQRLMILSGAR